MGMRPRAQRCAHCYKGATATRRLVAGSHGFSICSDCIADFVRLAHQEVPPHATPGRELYSEAPIYCSDRQDGTPGPLLAFALTLVGVPMVLAFLVKGQLLQLAWPFWGVAEVLMAIIVYGGWSFWLRWSAHCRAAAYMAAIRRTLAAQDHHA